MSGPIGHWSQTFKVCKFTFIDDYTMKIGMFFLSLETWAFKKFKTCKMSIETNEKKLIKDIFHGDRGNEFLLSLQQILWNA